MNEIKSISEVNKNITKEYFPKLTIEAFKNKLFLNSLGNTIRNTLTTKIEITTLFGFLFHSKNWLKNLFIFYFALNQANKAIDKL